MACTPPNWKPGGDIWLGLADKTAEARTQEELEQMTKEIEEVANRFGFSIRSVGTTDATKR